MRDRVAGLSAEMDLEMPGDTAISRRRILDALSDGTLDTADLDRSCVRILKWVDKYQRPADKTPVDWERHHELAAEIAADCAVLMKNDGTLPLDGTEKLYVSGELFGKMRYQGAGSSMIKPTFVTTPRDAFEENGIMSASLDECDVVLYFAGLTDEFESEGGDRNDMRLPADQLDEIEKLCGTGKKVVVVLFGGSPVELPFCDRVSAILNMYLPGQNGGRAVYDLLFGLKNPSGKLAETWPVTYGDVPCGASFGKGITEVYAEGTEVGYRYYNKHGIPVRFPFGYGLSYTSFSKSDWEKDGDTYRQTVTNTGGRYGAEVAQLFVGGELKGFRKVYLGPGESKTVVLTVKEDAPTVYPDEYSVSAEPPPFPVTLESRFTDLRQTFMGRVLFDSVMSVAKKQEKRAKKMKDGPEKDNVRKGAQFLRRILESNSLRSMSMSAGASFPYNFAEGFAELANRHLIKGVRCFMKKIKVPNLPKEEN